MNFPRKAIIAPSHDVRRQNQVEVTFHSIEEVQNAQRERYEIIRWLDE